MTRNMARKQGNDHIDLFTRIVAIAVLTALIVMFVYGCATAHVASPTPTSESTCAVTVTRAHADQTPAQFWAQTAVIFVFLLACVGLAMQLWRPR
jgi:ABC-type Na+ efflux pump permease subunit